MALVTALPAWASGAGVVGSAPLPGGVEGIRRALGDRIPTPPASIVADLTRRFYNATADAARRDAAFARLVAWLEACQTTDACTQSPLRADTVPLPGPAAFWLAHAFEQEPSADHLVLAILGDRGAALLYTALLSMDEPTRAWFVEHPDVVRRLSVTDRGALVVAAPFLRIENGRWRLPGGARADRLWMDLVIARLEDSPAFLLALLRAHEGLVTYALEVVATLDGPRQTRLLELDAANPAESVTAGRALLDALKASAEYWNPGERPFWRPTLDPSFMLARLTFDASGRLAFPGGRKVWQLLFDAGDSLPAEERIRDAWNDEAPVSTPWLVERAANAPLADRALRFEQVLFASRRFTVPPPAAAVDVVTAVWGYVRFPQLLRVLERMGVAQPARVAAIVRRADALAAAGEGPRARRALVQWQSLVTLVDYAARSGGASHESIEEAIDALARAPGEETTAARLAWLAPWLHVAPTADDVTMRRLEQALIAKLTAAPSAEIRRVTWEGETYRLDVGAADRDRIVRVRGRDNRPLLDAAFAVLAMSSALRGTARSAADDLTALGRIATAAGLERPAAVDDELGHEAREALASARRQLARDRATASASSRAELADLGERLATSALVELAYAFSMGWAEELPLTASAAARRHVFVRENARGRRQTMAWDLPVIVAERNAPWHVLGSLLGLDVGLSPVALRRVSKRPLTAAPLLNNADRTVLISTAAVLDRRDFTDEAQRALTTAVTRARAQLAGDPAALEQLAASAGVSPLRRTLAAWLASADRPALDSFFSLTELTRMGAGDAPLPSVFARWGNYDAPISGRLAGGPLPELAAERYAGRSGRLLACAVPDLQLALAIGLAEVDLPAALVPDLLTAALFDLVNTTPSRHTDDWEAIGRRARAVDREAVERYLGLLTTQGPLRADGAASIADAAPR